MIASEKCGRFAKGFVRSRADVLDDLMHHIESGEPAGVDTLEEAHSAISLLRLQKMRLLVRDEPNTAVSQVGDVVDDLDRLAARLPPADAVLVRDGIAEILRHRSLL